MTDNSETASATPTPRTTTPGVAEIRVCPKCWTGNRLANIDECRCAAASPLTDGAAGDWVCGECGRQHSGNVTLCWHGHHSLPPSVTSGEPDSGDRQKLFEILALVDEDKPFSRKANDFLAEISALRSEVERLQRDAERLDWLEAQRHTNWAFEDFGITADWFNDAPRYTIWRNGTIQEDTHHTSLREAIDAARTPSTDTQESDNG